MVNDGTLRSTPTVSDESVLGAISRAGLSADSFAATVVVNQLARAQTSYSGVVADKTAAIGAGTMTLTVGGVAKTITIDAANNSLEGPRSEEHTSELQSPMRNSYAVFR